MFDVVATPGFLAALAVSALAGFMRGFLGFGSGMLMAPVFAVLFGPTATVGVIVLMESVVTIQLWPSVRKQIEWRIVAPMGAVAAAMMPIGSWLLVSLDPDSLTRLIAIVVLVSVLILAMGWRYQGTKRPSASVGVGAISGVLMAATSLGNPPVALYFLSSGDEAATSRANFTGYFAVTLVALIAWMLAMGLIDTSVGLLAAAMLPVFSLASWAGARFFQRSDDQLYRRAALLLLALVAGYVLVRDYFGG
ncbi:MAG: sulfite exporter TauE/SafE family protein [Pseudomonadota bacterium]